MENASKALIIAGAILISILLISIGILLINSAQDTANSGTIAMSSQAIQAFNSQFTEYEGSNKSSREVSQLLDTVISSNASHSNQVVIRFYKKSSVSNQYKPRHPSFNPHELTLTSDVYLSERGTYGVADGHHILDISIIKDTVNYYNNGKYDIRFSYCNSKEAKKSINKSLNLAEGVYSLFGLI